MLPTGLVWARPEAWFLLLLLPVAVGLARWRRQGQGVVFPAAHRFHGLSRSLFQYVRHLPLVLHLMALIFLMAVLARPQSTWQRVDQHRLGVDILLVLDLSESMRAYDLRPNRLEATKSVLKKFIAARTADRLGLVVFSGASFTRMPLTTDHESLIRALDTLDTNSVGIEGTAVGDALLTAVNRFDFAGAQPAKSRVVILTTDGVSNRGIHPTHAAQILARRGIKLYAIGLGTHQLVPRLEPNSFGRWVPAKDIYGRPIYWEGPDDETLRRMATIGQGMFFRADHQEKLGEVLQSIDALEKNEIQVKRSVIRRELFAWPLAAALFFLWLELLVSRLWLRKLA